MIGFNQAHRYDFSIISSAFYFFFHSVAVHTWDHLDFWFNVFLHLQWKTLIDLKNDLSSGVYPAAVLPSQIYDPSSSSGEQKSLPSSLVDEIRTATESVRVGYSRIIRLCRSISQAVHACNKSKWLWIFSFIVANFRLIVY